MIVCIILLGFCLIRVPVASAASPSPGGSKPWSCHPEDVLLSILFFPDGVLRSRDLPPDARRPAGRAAPVHKFVRGVTRGSRYEARLSLVKEGVVMHEEWLQFHGAVAEDDEAQRITFAVPPLPAGRYTEFFEVYDACGLTASLSASAEDDQQRRLLAGLNREVEEEEAERVAPEGKIAVQLEAISAQLASAREQFRVLREQVRVLGGGDAGSGPNAACSVDLASAFSPSSSSTPERCHPEDVLLFLVTGPFEQVLKLACSCCALMTHVHRFVRGVARGSRYEARLSLVKEGVVMHEEWLHFHGAVAEDDEAQRITFAVPPLPAGSAGRYTERLEIYDACGLTASLSASAEDDQQLRLLAGLSQVRDVEEPVGNWFCERADEGLVNGSEDFARSSRHASPKSVHIHRSRTGQETGHDKSRDGPYETGFFDAMSIDARSPDSLLYHDDKSFHGAGSSLALHQVSFDTVLGLF